MRFVLLVMLAACGRVGFTGQPHSADAPAPDASDPVLTGCVLDYAMDEETWTGPGAVLDSCGANPGTAVNGATTVLDPARGRVGMFVGGTSCIEVPDAPALRPTTALTVSAWIKPAALSPSGFGIVSKRADFMVDTEYSIFIWASNGGGGTTNELYVDIDTENDRNSDTTTTFVDNEWRQVTVVYDGSEIAAERIRYYVDGQLTFIHAESSAAITPPQMEAGLAVGCLPLLGPAQAFDGSLDDVVIWRRALSAADVAAWHTATTK